MLLDDQWQAWGHFCKGTFSWEDDIGVCGNFYSYTHHLKMALINHLYNFTMIVCHKFMFLFNFVSFNQIVFFESLVVVSESASKGTSVASVTVSMDGQKPVIISTSWWTYLVFYLAFVSLYMFPPTQATDRDSGVNKQIDFEVTDVTFHETNNQTSDMGKVFEAVTTQQKEIYVGIIQWVHYRTVQSIYHYRFAFGLLRLHLWNIASLFIIWLE